jgi:biotin transport system substrate-specific component
VTNVTYADFFKPSLRKEALLYDLLLISGASIFIALSAQISIRLPFTPIPITGQTLAVLLTGVLLGSRRGSLAVLTYLIEGAAGLPVFAGAAAGITHLFGTTGGYLFGFIPAAFVCGYLAEKGWDRNYLTTFVLMLMGTAIIFFFGLSWLKIYVGSENILAFGLYPFIPGAFIKIMLATAILPVGWKLLKIKGEQKR